MEIPFLERRRPQWTLAANWTKSDAMLSALTGRIAHLVATVPVVEPARLQQTREEIALVGMPSQITGAAL